MSRRLSIVAVFAIAYFLSYFFRSANAIIAEDLTRELSLSAAQLGFMTSVFFVAFAAAQLPLGHALDRFGARRVTPPLMLAAALGSILFALAQTFAVLVLGRALIGLGMAGVLMGALKTFGGWFSAQRFATISGVFLGIGASGALGAATPLAYLNALVGWRAVFLGAAGATLLSALLLMLVSRDAPAPGLARVDAQTGRLRDIFRDPRFWRLAAGGFAVTGSMFAYQGLWAGPFLRESLGLSEVTTGNLLFLLSGGVMLGYFGVGWLADRFGLGRVVLLGGGTFAVVQLTLAFFSPDWPLWLLRGLFFTFGVLGAISLLYFAHAQRLFPHMTGRATTAVNLFGIGGGALLQWGLGLVVGLFPDTAAGKPAAAYSTLFLLTGVLVAVATLAYAPLGRLQKPQQPLAQRRD
jgi:predicted MFS family arabinose efflux permease